jgi:hypothetical protein
MAVLCARVVMAAILERVANQLPGVRKMRKRASLRLGKDEGSVKEDNKVTRFFICILGSIGIGLDFRSVGIGIFTFALLVFLSDIGYQLEAARFNWKG